MYIIQLDGDCSWTSSARKLQEAAGIGYDTMCQALAAIEDTGFIPDVEDDRILVIQYEINLNARPVWGFFGWHWDHAFELFGRNWKMEQGCLIGHGDSWYEELMEDY